MAGMFNAGTGDSLNGLYGTVFTSSTCTATAVTVNASGGWNLHGNPLSPIVLQQYVRGTSKLNKLQAALHRQAMSQLALNDEVPEGNELGEGEYELPDGARLIIDAAGNYRLDDKQAKVVYRANRMRNFNPFINASDLVADFIKDLRHLSVPQDRALAVPMELFINWLIHRAADADGEPAPEDVPKIDSHPALLPFKAAS